MTATARGVVAVVPDELVDGFRLAGAEAVGAETVEEVVETVERLVAEGTVGLIAVHEPLLAGVPDEDRRRWEDLVEPTIVPIPSGEREPSTARHARLARRLQAAVGYHVTFEEEP